MTSYFTKGFYDKLYIPSYPLKGFWFQFAQLESDTPTKESWTSTKSDLHECNTIITTSSDSVNKTNIIRLGIRVTTLNELSNLKSIYTHMLLYCCDKLLYSDITEVTNVLDSLAIAIQIKDTNGILIDGNNINIFNIVLDSVDKPIASIEGICDDDNPEVGHYTDYLTGAVNYANINSNSNLIEYTSGDSKARSIMTYNRPDQLKGSMTIKSSGVIQL